MQTSRPVKELVGLENNSLIRVTGICETQKDKNGHNQ